MINFRSATQPKLVPLLTLSLGTCLFSQTNDFPAVQNTQKETIPLLKPEEALAHVTLPRGFKATLFAAEPQVQQPIGFTLDSKGRLWVAENYTYAEKGTWFDTRFRDRIVILEDMDGDGRADRRKVFWDRGDRLTSVATGFGGVFAICSPNLLFIPDRDGDDIPDGEPEVLLDGFEAQSIRHTFANGLKLGPDGWLYARHGILATSYVGKPGTPREQRIPMNCSIWRFHPVTRAFEVVAQGTTNPWGHDWDDYGQLFFINTVIGHLWHCVPGAYYKRMYGEHANPHLYELIDQTADHFHWDTKESWDDIRAGVTATTLKAGGGHAHSGLLIYLGDNWPDEYRGSVFAVNYHGRRINHDRLERRGAGYVGKHKSDFATFDDPWFRGVDLLLDPDGGVYVSDWSDIGECHDDDGVHRTTGRIYKITHGDKKLSRPEDVQKMSDAELVVLQLHRNDWFVRQARQTLYERSHKGVAMTKVQAALRDMFDKNPDITRQLRAMWCLYVTGGASEQWLRKCLNHENEHVRVWAVKLLTDQNPPSSDLLRELASRANEEKSGLVLLSLASVLQELPVSDRWSLAKTIAGQEEFAEDPVLPLLLWYGIESAVPLAPDQALELVAGKSMSKVRNFVARRLTSELDDHPEPVNHLVQALGTNSANFQRAVLTGMTEALRGWRKATPPKAWASVSPSLLKTSDEAVRKLAQELAVVFGDGRAVDELRDVVANKKADLNSRRRALQTLVQSRAEGLLPLIQDLLTELEIAPDAVRGLATLGHPETPAVLLKMYAKLRSGTAKVEAINALASRTAFARELLAAVEKASISRQEVGPIQIRQLRSLNDAEINRKVAVLWPEQRELTAEKQQQLTRYKNLLTPDRISSGDPAQGGALYGQLCGTCHVLFGEGTNIGPELTGSDRKNLDYLLGNIVDPNAVVAENYRVSTIRLKDERVINGVIGAQTDRTITVQTPTEKLVLERKEVEAIEPSGLSMMPEGLLESLSENDVRDLMAYLMAAAPPLKAK